MTSQLKQTRTNKQAMLKAMANDIMDLLILKKGRLDKVDFRVLKEISKKLNECKSKADPVSDDTHKIVSRKQRE
jgi:hypothetical protein